MKYRLYLLANGEVMLCLQGRRCLVRETQPVRYTYHFILALRRSRCASVVADCPVDLEATGNVLSCLNTGRRDSTHPVKPENFTLGTHWFVVPMSQRNFAFYALHTGCSIRGVRRGVYWLWQYLPQLPRDSWDSYFRHSEQISFGILHGGCLRAWAKTYT